MFQNLSFSAAAEARPTRTSGVDRDGAAGGRAQPGQRVRQLLLPVAADAGDAVDLAAAHGEADIVDADAAGPPHGQALDPEPHLAQRPAAAFRRCALFAHHGTGERLGIEARGFGAGEHRLAAAHHRHPRRIADHLAQLVGDQDHRVAVVREAAHEGERLERLLVGQHRCGLVEDENAGAEQQHLKDLDALLLGDGEFADDSAGVHLESHLRRLRCHRLSRIARTADAERAAAGEHDVLGDSEALHQLVVLVDHADAEPGCIGGRGDRGGPAIHRDRPLVRRVEPAGDVHQGGLAGPVLTEERVDLAPVAGERCPAQRRPGIERLACTDDF